MPISSLPAIEKELQQPKRWWYVSFAEDGPPRGRGFLGAVLIEAHGVITAAIEAHRRGINPGGQVIAVPFPKCPLCEQGDTPILSSVSDKMVHMDATGHKVCILPAEEFRGVLLREQTVRKLFSDVRTLEQWEKEL